MNMEWTTILFDLDGTLTDPKVGITKGVQYALSQAGIDEPNLDELIPFIGPPLHTSFEEIYHFSPAKAKQAVEDYRVYFRETGMYENVPYEGIDELLGRLRENGRRLLVATSKATVFAEQILHHFGLAEFFDEIVGSNLDSTRSEKAEVIQYALRHFDERDKSNIVMVGDRKFDIVGAQANGIASVGVLYGYGSVEEIRASSPAYICDSVASLERLLMGDAQPEGRG